MQQSKAIVITQGIPFRLVASMLCVALAIATSTIFHVGNLPGHMFLPMHIPIIVCGFVCGHKCGGVAGFVTPFISHFITGRPIASPMPVVYFMAFELAAYGFFAGLFYWMFFRKKREKTVVEVKAEGEKNGWVDIVVEGALIVAALAISLVLGRVAFGLARLPFMGAGNFGWSAFMRSMFVTSLPGIAVQIVFIPILIVCLRRGRVIGSERENTFGAL
ncbi:MAG: ECF transporter S component [Firmicutes bacterium]|nr:ECF transporter S component [Bacillota bacterium]